MTSIASSWPVASIRRVKVGRLGCRRPDSYALMTDGAMPVRRASSVCESCARWRAARSRSAELEGWREPMTDRLWVQRRNRTADTLPTRPPVLAAEEVREAVLGRSRNGWVIAWTTVAPSTRRSISLGLTLVRLTAGGDGTGADRTRSVRAIRPATTTPAAGWVTTAVSAGGQAADDSRQVVGVGRISVAHRAGCVGARGGEGDDVGHTERLD